GSTLDKKAESNRSASPGCNIPGSGNGGLTYARSRSSPDGPLAAAPPLSKATGLVNGKEIRGMRGWEVRSWPALLATPSVLSLFSFSDNGSIRPSDDESIRGPEARPTLLATPAAFSLFSSSDNGPVPRSDDGSVPGRGARSDGFDDPPGGI